MHPRLFGNPAFGQACAVSQDSADDSAVGRAMRRIGFDAMRCILCGWLTLDAWYYCMDFEVDLVKIWGSVTHSVDTTFRLVGLGCVPVYLCTYCTILRYVT